MNSFARLETGYDESAEWGVSVPSGSAAEGDIVEVDRADHTTCEVMLGPYLYSKHYKNESYEIYEIARRYS